jgi:hypothetical protein
MMTDMIELRLTGTAVQTLADNAHIPGYPGEVDVTRVADDDPDRNLHRAAAYWYTVNTRVVRMGRGTVRYGQCSTTDATHLLEYLEGVAGALCTSDDPEARREGRAVGRAVDQAVSHLRRRGVPVRELDRGPFTDFVIGGPES